jgi:hypothetical protein
MQGLSQESPDIEPALGRLHLRLAGRWPWAAEITAAVIRPQAIPSG